MTMSWPVRVVGAKSVAGSSGLSAGAVSLWPPRRSSNVKTNGFTMIDTMAPARIRSRDSFGTMFRVMPMPIRMKENSPICARLAETVKAVDRLWPKARTIR